MKKKIALVTGISGQDGAYLAKLLLEKNYKVIGSDRRSSRDNRWRLTSLGINPDKDIVIEDLELNEMSQIMRILNKYKFDEIYNLAAQSFVTTSFSNPILTADITAVSVLRLLEGIRNVRYKTKFYQASSSEMFGDVKEIPQSEKTELNPQSPYAIAKTFAHYCVKNYRDSYKLYTVSGICFNHESPLRGEEFVTRKITVNLAKINFGLIKSFELGNVYSKRDWGFAGDYVEGMWRSLQQKKPNDYVFATGETYRIFDFINEAKKYLDFKTNWVGSGMNLKLINSKTKKPILKISKKFFRPAEVNLLLGDPKRTKKILKWQPKVNFKNLVKMMMLSDLAKYKR